MLSVTFRSGQVVHCVLQISGGGVVHLYVVHGYEGSQVHAETLAL